MQGCAYVDERFVDPEDAKISIFDWGFLHSDATYDVAHVWRGRFFRLDDHLDRFAASCRALRLDPSSREAKELIAHDNPTRNFDNIALRIRSMPVDLKPRPVAYSNNWVLVLKSKTSTASTPSCAPSSGWTSPCCCSWPSTPFRGVPTRRGPAARRNSSRYQSLRGFDKAGAALRGPGLPTFSAGR